MPVRYRRILKHHPLRELLGPRHPGETPLRYPVDAPWSIVQAGMRAYVGILTMLQAAGRLPPTLDDRRFYKGLVREFMAFRERALDAMSEFAPTDLGATPGIAELACWRVFQHGPESRFDVHLGALEDIWLSAGAADAPNGPLALGVPVEGRGAFLARHYAVAVLLEFDTALICRARGDIDGTLQAAVYGGQSASSSFNLETAPSGAGDIASLAATLAALRSEQARAAANLRHSNSDEGRAKLAVCEQWRRWRAGELHFQSVAAFAREALKQHIALNSGPTVERWVREWDQGKNIPDLA
ncbi:hypothetical protein LMG27952_01741 [Paraburkholderia hiiakae]|uniref:Uncharacterized protein n=1 Tax=Paraburkholderia hiiakae TaxID=1081782 RepID=A0ABM8NGW5_9BURK|nr:hypothetical protein [Paraburkholderia hiiakae]CAD6524612.1 hypothetical protein LMG27952_01741 [Paraburkholderia hiiakae]